MITNPRPLTTAEALLLCLVAVALGVGFVVGRRRPTLPEAIAIALIATVLVTATITAWSVVRDAWHARAYSARAAARVGPEDNGIDTNVVDRAAKVIPQDATYQILLSRSTGAARDGVFRAWALASLLPRVAVEDRSQAQWVLTLGAPPSAFGVRAADVHWLASSRGRRVDAWVGRLR